MRTPYVEKYSRVTLKHLFTVNRMEACIFISSALVLYPSHTSFSLALICMQQSLHNCKAVFWQQPQHFFSCNFRFMGNVAAKEILVSPITIEVRLQEKRGLCRPYLATYKEMYICIFVYVSVCIYTYIYICIHTYTYIC